MYTQREREGEIDIQIDRQLDRQIASVHLEENHFTSVCSSRYQNHGHLRFISGAQSSPTKLWKCGIEVRTDQNEKLCAASAKADWFSSSQIDPLSGKGRDNHSSLVQHGHRAVGAEGNLISGLRTERFSMIQYDFNIMIQSYPDTSTDLNISACSAALENHRASAISPAGHWSTNCN